MRSCAAPVIALLALVLTFGGLVAPASGEAPKGETPAPRIRLERFIRKLDRPVAILPDPAGRLLAVEQTGRVLMLDDAGTPAKTPYLDLSKTVFVEYECGLLGLAFHPKFAENGLLYVNYTAKRPNLKTFVCEFKVEPGADRVDPATVRVVLTIDQPYPNHNGGHLAFGPDGYLYVGTGDGGAAHDPQGHGQNTKSLLGKMLRIDVTPRQKYAVPKDNPFVGDDNYAPEIWATGLRNPWRYAFDPATGVLYAADVGQELWEEIDVITKGGNYGWRVREGSHDLHPVPNPPETIDPIFEYSHNRTAASVTGGVVYRGKRIPALVGWYLFADYSDGRIWGLKYADGKVLAHALLIDPNDPARNGGQRPTQPSSFGLDADGEPFLCDANGPVYRILPGDAK